MKKQLLRKTALFLAIVVFGQAILPTMAMALTSGPSQPEMQGFQPIGTSDMVDLFTGDFSYNIPLCDVDGYPLNLSYNADPRMDDEASWVGLGWSLNPGIMSREVRGYPDDFKDETIKKEYNLKSNYTVGVLTKPDLEIFGISTAAINFSAGLHYNSYRGYGFDLGASPAMRIGLSNKGNTQMLEIGRPHESTIGLNLSYSSAGGLDIDVYSTIGFLAESSKYNRFQVSTAYNSRQGLKQFNFQGAQDNYMKRKTLRVGGGLSFSEFSYFPTSPLPIVNQAYNLHVAGGGEIFGLFPNLTINGYYTEQKLLERTQNQQAFGYLYLDEAEEGRQDPKDDRNLLLDYNIESQKIIRQDSPTLPIPSGTYDLFSATGQGMNAQFRAVRNDVGLLKPAYHANHSHSIQLGAELGGGLAFKGGFDANYAKSITKTQAWTDRNSLQEKLDFTQNEGLYESVYFKSTGEPTVTDESFWQQIGTDLPIKASIGAWGPSPIANRFFTQEENKQFRSNIAVNSTLQRTGRESRNQTFSYLTAAEAAQLALDKNIISYDTNTLRYTNCGPGIAETIQRSAYPDHHLSEINVTQANGGRYVYGIPVYNNKQREVTFSVDAPASSSATFDQTSSTYSLVGYTPGSDNSTNNNKGKDHYFEATEIPPYAHSYLLTAVLSADYVDKTGDGITDDDLGNAVKFNYNRWKSQYKWRMPLQSNMARYHEGFQSYGKDDKASYLYGEKEIWYMHSIESRTMVAQFYTSDRKDALGVVGENGGIDNNQSLRKLDRIVLYTKSDLIANGTDAVPIKTVHFEYDESYPLCPNVPNQLDTGKGKLTLKRVYFTYGNNQRGQLNPYVFHYNGPASNFSYNTGHTDRWGQYKQNPSGYPRNDEFPYSLQDSLTVSANIASWNLTKIDLPSGGEIEVSYEADDYAYVQDKRAGQMFIIEGFTNSTDDTNPSSQLYQNGGSINNYIVIEDIPNSHTTEALPLRRYLEDVKKIYFKCKVDLDGKGNWDYLTGYLDYDKAAVVYNNNRLYIPIKTIKERNTTFHPISLAAYQLMRLELPHLVYEGYENNGSPTQIIKALIGFGKEIKRSLNGFNRTAKLESKGREVEVAKSWIRLSNPSYKKYGGGSRVKQLIISDEWTGGGGESKYGQTYDYTTSETIAGQPIQISSGVAAYEPLIGGEENLMKNPLPYKEQVVLAPNNFYYNETPIGESLYPSPVIGYSKVKIASIPYTDVKRTGTGYTTNEFYTARDFPVRTAYTKPDRVRSRANPILRKIKIAVNDYMAMSQGFVVEVNDMHGKPKANWTHDEQGVLLASTQYEYRQESTSAERKQLNNQVQVINGPSHTIQQKEIGLDVDLWQEMREETNNTTGLGVSNNVDAFPLLFIPIITTSPIPIFQSEKTQLRTSATTKFIKRFGLLEKVTVMENGSSITTENLLYDGSTGDVLLTRTENEFDDPMYTFNYPVHWAYDKMGQAYQNIHSIFPIDAVSGGNIQAGSNPDPRPNLVPGDEVLVLEAGQVDSKRYWVTKEGTANPILVDRDGQLPTFNNPISIKVIRSGRRNQAGFSMGSFSSRANPIQNNQLQIPSDTAVIDASALTFTDRWQMRCEEINANNSIQLSAGDVVNPYVEGLRGNWRPYKSYVFYSDRNPSTLPVGNGKTNIRRDGTLADFSPFWTYNGGSSSWEPNPGNEWTESNEISIFDQRGNELENKDPIGIYSAAQFGYNQNRVTAVAGNAKSEEIVFDGFEDYAYDNDCNAIQPYRSLVFNGDIIAGISHSGRHALRLGTLDSLQVATYGSECNNEPIALFTSSDNCGVSPLFISFDANGSSDPDSHTLTYSWDFGDGTGGSGVMVNHTFTGVGTYQVTLTVEDSRGAISTAIGFINVVANSSQCNLLRSSSTIAKAAEDPYFLSQCSDCLPLLTPDTSKAYLVSLWVATDTSLQCGLPPSGPALKVIFNGTTTQETALVPTGPVIEGWQRVEGKIEAPADYSKLTFQLHHTGLGQAYFDDFRFHPWRSNMQSYVYDPFSMRLMATLDENNYASFYEYNDEGILIRVKRETEKGVMTVQESRTVLGRR